MGLGGLALVALVVQACGGARESAVTTTTRGGSATAPGAQLWVARYNGPANGPETVWPGVVRSMAVSPDGAKVFVTGASEGAATGNDYATVAYDAATGEQLWAARYDGPANSDDIAGAVTVSPDGAAVVVTGGSTGTDAGFDTATVAYAAATGAQLWVARYDGPAHKNDGGGSIAVDPSGARVFVTGTSEEAAEAEKTYATVAYNAATGAQVWVARYNGPVNRDSAGSMAVSPSGGTVFVTGWSEIASGEKDYATVAYNAATGARLWVTNYHGSGGDNEGRSVAVSPDGAKLFVTGEGPGATGPAYSTVAYDASTGAQLWARSHDSPPKTGSTYASPATVSPDGVKLFVTGIHATVAYNAATGTELWVHADSATSVAVSPDGTKVFVAGTNEGTTGNDYASAAYDAATGKQLWAARYDGPAKGDDSADSVAVSPTGDTVFVTGISEGAGSGSDYATVAYRG